MSDMPSSPEQILCVSSEPIAEGALSTMSTIGNTTPTAPRCA